MENLKLSSPWVTFAHEITMLFMQDPEVKVICDDDETEIKLYVDNPVKADALQKLLPEKKEFGNITVKISVIPANTDESDPVCLYEKAFDGNPILSYIRTVEGVIGRFNYVVFRNEVVQFFNDQLDDVNGNKSTLYQDIAKDVFGDNEQGVFFCTDTPDNLGAPLGEWP